MALDLVIVGNIGFDEITTLYGTKVVRGGAPYYCAVGASLFSKNVGLVSRVGSDYPINDLIELGINIDGVKVVKGKSALFQQKYDSSNQRIIEFAFHLNVGEQLSPADIPATYFQAKFIHIATNLPKKQVEFLTALKGKSEATLFCDTSE